MIPTAGLSLDQAPPLDLPLRLFLTAPLFAAAAGVLLLLDADAVLATRWSPAALAATHLVTIGFLGPVMIGALLQMLPVLAGVPVPAVRPVAVAVHLLLAAGAALLAAGFLGAGASALAGGAVLAALGLGLFGITLLGALWHARGGPANPRGFPLPGIALLVTVGLGLLLTLALLGRVPLPRLLEWTGVHAAWGLFGWAGLLILTVGFQVVPLFHVTPAYPRLVTRALVPVLFATLCALTTLPLLPAALAAPLERPLYGILAAGFALFAVLTLVLQARRARARLDATLLHWWAAMGALLAAVAAWLMAAPDELIGLLLLAGVGIGLPSGMLLKIVPFLCWFHLQTRQIALGAITVRIPHMHRLLPEGPARGQALLHMAALLLLAAGFLEPLLARAGAALLVLAALWLLVLLAGTAARYRGAARALQAAADDAPATA
jgi:lipid-A-disaccharide synthase-like uncharacterized protein